MATKTDICNLALSLIGEELSTLTDANLTNGDTKVARTCNLHYDQTLEEVTRMHTWNCAKARAELTVIDSTVFGWNKEAPLPAACIRPIALTTDSSYYRYLIFKTEWVIEGRTVRSNQGENFLLYETVPTLANMDALFMRAFYTLLAIKICIPISGDRAIRTELIQEMESLIMPEARRVNGFEGYQSPIADSEWLEATLISSTGGSTSWQALSVGDIPM